jgi:hypothetical protein
VGGACLSRRLYIQRLYEGGSTLTKMRVVVCEARLGRHGIAMCLELGITALPPQSWIEMGVTWIAEGVSSYSVLTRPPNDFVWWFGRRLRIFLILSVFVLHLVQKRAAYTAAFPLFRPLLDSSLCMACLYPRYFNFHVCYVVPVHGGRAVVWDVLACLPWVLGRGWMVGGRKKGEGRGKMGCL